MLRLVKLILFYLLIIVLMGCQTSEHYIEKEDYSNIINDLDVLDLLYEYLQYELWVDRDSYDAGHHLMIPLHAAFVTEDIVLQRKFYDQFDQYSQTVRKDNSILPENWLQRLHYNYLASRYLVLSMKYNNELVIPELYDILTEDIYNLWCSQKIGTWGTSEQFTGMKERIIWKLEVRDVKHSYYRAITDDELFLFAIAADLRNYERMVKNPEQHSDKLTDILNMAYTIFENKGVEQVDGGWLFQPGVFKDHRDYIYAGQIKITENMSPLPVDGIGMDTSHSHRLPLFLTSLAEAYENNDHQYVFYKEIKKKLERQFYNKVLVLPDEFNPEFRTKNFMDGTNGVYRYRYSTLGDNEGYGPYELSGTIKLGWWSFLGTQRISEMYNYMYNNNHTYIIKKSNRERNPILSSHHEEINRMIIKFASVIAEQY